MSINVNDKNLGHATAYAYYKAGGGTMTEAEFTEFMADFGTASQTAVEAAQAALEAKYGLDKPLFVPFTRKGRCHFVEIDEKIQKTL